MNLIERAKNIIVTPATEWEVINNEPTTTKQLYTGYIMLLAAIGPIAIFIGGGLFAPIFGLVHGVIHYVFGLVGVYLIAWIINALAPTFGAQPNMIQALKVVAYSYTPAWIASVLFIIPFVGMLVALAALYSLFLLYIGLPILMRVTQEKLIPYLLVIFVCAVVVMGVLFKLSWAFGFYGMYLGGPHVSNNVNVDVDAVRQLGASIDAANKSANVSNPPVIVAGNPAAAINAAAAAMQGNGQVVEPVDQALLKTMLPETIGNMKRNKFEAEKVAMANFKLSKAEAGYSDDQGKSANLTITDAGGAAPFAMLAAWALVEQERETDDGYEKMGKVDGRPVHEKFNKKMQDGEYSVVVANRFLVEAQGHQIDMDTLKQAVAGIGLDKLEALKNSGVK